MKKPSPFVIQKFTNPSGEIVYRVYGRVAGERVRKNFATLEEAKTERDVQEINWLREGTTRAAITRLTDAQLQEAEAVFRRLEGQPRALSFYVDFALTNYREPENQKKLADAVTDYVAAKEYEFKQDQISAPQMERIRADLKRLVGAFAKKTVAEITPAALIAFLEKNRGGMKTHNNRRGVLSTFFKFCFQRGWIAENPIPKVPHYRIRRKRGGAQTLTAEQAAKLMGFMETYQGGKMVTYFALCLFAGIRPAVPHGEISKFKPESVDLDAGIIHITPEVSKVREARKIAIQPNLAAWLRAYPLEKYPIVLGNFRRRRRKFSKLLRESHELDLSHDVLRHTYISMFVAKFRSIGEAAIQAGNSETIIRKHYLDLKTTKEAEAFYAIVPKHAKLQAEPAKITAMPVAA